MKPSADTIALHETAADWYLRRHDPSWSRVDQLALEAWLRADPRHVAAYGDLDRTWEDFSAIERPALASDPAKPLRSAPAPRIRTPDHGTPDYRKPQGLIPGFIERIGMRRWVSSIATACLVLAAGGWLIYDNTPSFRIEVATAHGETRALDLPDGSRIAVNMDTHIEVRLYPRRREVILDRGEAYFQVSHAPEKPFTVASADKEVRVVGTIFDVRSTPALLVVKVQEGRVEVRGDPACDQLAVLSARQGISMGTACARPAPFDVATDMVGDWRTGQLVFRRTPLAAVARELSGYLGRPIDITDAATGALPVSGFATTAEPQSFLESLPDLLKVRVQRQTDGGYRISAH